MEVDETGGGGNTPGTERSLPDGLDLPSDMSEHLDLQSDFARFDEIHFDETGPKSTIVEDSSDHEQPHHDNLHAGEEFPRALFEARWTSLRLTSLVLPWETGAMSQIFGMQPIQQVPLVEPLLNAEALTSMSNVWFRSLLDRAWTNLYMKLL